MTSMDSVEPIREFRNKLRDNKSATQVFAMDVNFPANTRLLKKIRDYKRDLGDNRAQTVLEGQLQSVINRLGEARTREEAEKLSEPYRVTSGNIGNFEAAKTNLERADKRLERSEDGLRNAEKAFEIAENRVNAKENAITTLGSKPDAVGWKWLVWIAAVVTIALISLGGYSAVVVIPKLLEAEENLPTTQQTLWFSTLGLFVATVVIWLMAGFRTILSSRAERRREKHEQDRAKAKAELDDAKEARNTDLQRRNGAQVVRDKSQEERTEAERTIGETRYVLSENLIDLEMKQLPLLHPWVWTGFRNPPPGGRELYIALVRYLSINPNAHLNNRDEFARLAGNVVEALPREEKNSDFAIRCNTLGKRYEALKERGDVTEDDQEKEVLDALREELDDLANSMYQGFQEQQYPPREGFILVSPDNFDHESAREEQSYAGNPTWLFNKLQSWQLTNRLSALIASHRYPGDLLTKESHYVVLLDQGGDTLNRMLNQFNSISGAEDILVDRRPYGRGTEESGALSMTLLRELPRVTLISSVIHLG